MLRYHVILFDRSTGHAFSASCVNPDKQCIIHCLWSKSAIILRDHGLPCELPNLWPTNNPDLIQLTTKSGATCLIRKKAHNVNYLTTWGCFWLMCELEWTERWHWSIGDGIDQWRRCFMPALQLQEDIMTIHC